MAKVDRRFRGTPPGRILDMLQQLVDKSLVLAEEFPDGIRF
jgi:hypothetical protein